MGQQTILAVLPLHILDLVLLALAFLASVFFDSAPPPIRSPALVKKPLPEECR